MYAKSREILDQAIDDLLHEKGNHPKFVQRFQKFFDRKEEWVLIYRQNLITRMNNTNNFAEATIRILKDIVLCRTKAFNVVALTDFSISMWEPYLIKKLLEYAHSRQNKVNVIYERFLKKTENFTSDQLREISKDMFSFTNESKTVYTINSDIGFCSCPSGTSGAFCKHQFFLMREKNISFFCAPPISPSDKHQLAVLALGEKCPSPEFFESFIGASSADSLADVLQNSSNNFPSIHDTSSSECVQTSHVTAQRASKKQKDEIRKELSRLSNLLLDDDTMQESAANKVLRTLKEIGNVNDLSKIYLFKSITKKTIKVQPTSISRRRPGVPKSGRRIPSGRPSCLERNKGIKRKRSLKINIEENKPNAKSHGINH